MDECIFCKVKNKTVAVSFVYESDRVLAFNDLDPQAEIHILIVPKEHIPSFTQIDVQQWDTVAEMIRVAQKLIITRAIENKYRLLINGGSLQHIPHFHWHLLGGKFKGEK